MSAAGPVNMMTIDVEDYFHVSALASSAPRDRWPGFESRVAANTDRLLALFAERGITATFFVLGWVAERHPDLVRRIVSGGHELASHGYAHELVYDLTRDQFAADIRRSKALIEDLGGAAVRGYRAPSYSITTRSLWALDVLIEAGFEYDSSIYPIHHDRYGIPDAPRHAHLIERDRGRLLEIPGSTIRVAGMNWPIGGGGYFRLLPYLWTSAGIARVNDHEQRPVCFYLHPWEIDPAQPRLPASRLSAFRHYRNLHLTEARLQRLIARFRFGSIRDVLAAELVAATSSLTPAASAVATGVH